MLELLAIHMLRKKVEAIERIQPLSCHNVLFVDWHTATQQILIKVFGENSSEVAEFKKIRFKPRPREGIPETGTKEVFLYGLDEAQKLLLNAQQRIIPKRSTNFKSRRSRPLNASDPAGDETVVFEALLSKAVTIADIKEVPQERRERLDKILTDAFELLTEDTPNHKRVKELSGRLTNEMTDVLRRR
ncbi:hypothetical protein SY88_12905 [Clostridiales bacterium PH28_bin88]|nr:hypothetical protein SY88_12905 [Clostridiales bacterium PH28_bin88]